MEIKLYKIDRCGIPHTGYSYIYLLGSLDGLSLDFVAGEFTSRHKELTISNWSSCFAAYLKKEYGLRELPSSDIESVCPSLYGINYASA